MNLIEVQNYWPTQDLQTRNNVSCHGSHGDLYYASIQRAIGNPYSTTCMPINASPLPLLQLSVIVALSYTNVPLQNYIWHKVIADAAQQWNLVELLQVHTTVKYLQKCVHACHFQSSLPRPNPGKYY